MKEYISDENKVEIKKTYDVVVVGGGVAGVAAALAAKRNSCSVLLIEKSVMLGGLATLGLIAIYLPLCDGNGKKVVGGIAEELLHLSIKYSYDNLDDHWRKGGDPTQTAKRYQTVFSPPEFVIALDEVFEEEKIDVLYDTVFVKPVMDGGNCTHVIVENKSGRVAYGTKSVVDASGDADVFHRARAKTEESDNWLSYWAYATSLDRMKDAIAENRVDKGIHLQWFGGEAGGVNAIKTARKYFGTDAEEVTSFVIDGRKLLKKNLDENTRFSRTFLTLPGMAQFRTTRRICGYYELSEEDVNTRFDDSIGATGDWRKRGPWYEIPYRALIAPGYNNLIAAGRIIASKGDAWEVTRVIPPAAMTGQAAGTAAALAIQMKRPLQEVPIELLQHRLAKEGVMIHFEKETTTVR